MKKWIIVFVCIATLSLIAVLSIVKDYKKFDLSEPLTIEKMEQFLNDPPTAETLAIKMEEDESFDDVLYHLACMASEHEPEKTLKVFLSEDYLYNLGRHSPICREWLINAKVPETKPLLDLYYELSGMKSFDGTLRLDIAHAWGLLKWQASLDVHPKDENYTKCKAELYFPTNFEVWKKQGKWEQLQYRKAVRFRKQAQLALQNYYRQQFKLSADESNRLSIYYLNRLAFDYLGRAKTSPSLGYFCSNLEYKRMLQSFRKNIHTTKK